MSLLLEELGLLYVIIVSGTGPIVCHWISHWCQNSSIFSSLLTHFLVLYLSVWGVGVKITSR